MREENAKNDEKYENLSFSKTYTHYKYGGRAPMYIDISDTYFGMLTPDDFDNVIGAEKTINLATKKLFSTSGLTLGSVRIQYLGNLKIRISNEVNGIRYNDIYDFEEHKIDSNMKKSEKERVKLRNKLTKIGGNIHSYSFNIPSEHKIDDSERTRNTTKPFKIYFKGIATISPNKTKK